MIKNSQTPGVVFRVLWTNRDQAVDWPNRGNRIMGNCSMRRALIGVILILLAGAAARATVFEAEDATLNGVTALANSTASGGYRVIQFDAEGDYVSYDVVPDGNYAYITYSLGLTSAKQCSVYVNGTDVTTATFYPTGGWSTYKPLLLETPVTNSVRLQLDADDMTFNAGESCASQDKMEVLDVLTTDLADLKVVEGRFLANLMRWSGSQAVNYMNSMSPDGSWSDLDYTTNEVVYAHLSRCEEMARGYNKPGHALEGDEQLLWSFRQAFHYWMVNDFQDWNWWDNEIGVTRDVADIMLIARGEILPADWTKGMEIVHRAWPPPNNARGRGQNLIYRVKQTMVCATLEDDPALLYDATDRTAGEIRVPSSEGIQVDWAFHQHGPQLYWGGYGQGFSSDISGIAIYVGQTAYTIPGPKMEILSGLILDGQQWCIRGQMLDAGATGRGISRPNASTAGASYGNICDRMVEIGVSRSAEFEAMAKHVRYQTPAPPQLHGNRHFWTADFMSHRREDYYVALKMSSRRIYGTESGNDEGLKNYHLPDGATWLYKDGKEYDHIYPTLEWRRIPGITCEQYPSAIPLCNWGSGSYSLTYWAGGVSDGEYGMAGFELVRRNVRARKAGFFFDDCFVLLGAGISCSGGYPVYTTLNQCLLAGDVVVHDGSSARTLSAGEQTDFTNPRYVLHDGVGYALFDAPKVTVREVEQSGSWYSINHGQSTDIVTKDVFSAWIDHGSYPVGATYAYAVLPETTQGDLDTWTASPPVRVVSNSETEQAVWHDGLDIGAVAFHSAGSADLKTGFSVSVDKPCFVLLRFFSGGLRVAVSNPLNAALAVNVTVSGEVTGTGATYSAGSDETTLAFSLPSGNYAGQSVMGEYLSPGAPTPTPTATPTPTPTLIIGATPTATPTATPVVIRARAGEVWPLYGGRR